MTKTSVQNILIICKTYSLPVPRITWPWADGYVLIWDDFGTFDEEEAREHLRALHRAGERTTYVEPQWPRHPLCRLGG